MKNRNIRINEIIQGKFKSVLKCYKGKQYCINFKLKKILTINHKIPCKVMKFINVFLVKVIQILISHVLQIIIFYILVSLGINPKLEWLAVIISKIIIYIIIKILSR